MERLHVQGAILTPDSGQAYADALRRNSELSTLPAAYVFQPTTFTDIPPVLQYATSQTPRVEIAIKGGGAHTSTWASSDGGIVVDLSKLNKVILAEDNMSVSVQGGALWDDVYKVTSEAKVDVVGASLWFVGVGGFTLGGGYGPLSGEYGLAIDNLLSATVVLADGRIVKTSREQEPDLFWALRGGGGQFGIVVEFTFRTYPSAGPFSSTRLTYTEAKIPHLLKVIREWKNTQGAAERFTMSFARGPGPHYEPMVVIMPLVLHDDSGTSLQTSFAPFATTPIKSVIYPDLFTLSHAADAVLANAPRKLVIRGTLFTDFYPELILPVWEKWRAFTEQEDVRASAVLWDMTLPDRIADVQPNESALSKRVPHYWMAVQGRSSTDSSVEKCRQFTAEIAEFVREKNTEISGHDLGWFLNMCQGVERPEDVFGDNLTRLRRVKAKYDPGKVFSKGVVIEPLQE